MVPNLEKICERHFLSMDWAAKSYFGRATKEVFIEEFLRVHCFRVAFGRFSGKLCTRGHVWLPNLENFYERNFLRMDCVAKVILDEPRKR